MWTPIAFCAPKLAQRPTTAEKEDQMIATYTEPVRTPLPFETAVDAMRAALRAYAGEATDEALALALAKTTLESGRDKEEGLIYTKSYCFCIGNIKVGASYKGQFTAYPCNEVHLDKAGNKFTVFYSPEGQLEHKGGPVRGQRYTGPPDDNWHPQCRFRAYAGPTSSAYEYADFLSTAKGYGESWQMLLRGDPAGFVGALKRRGYFTADEGPYRRSVESLHREYLAKLKGLPAEEAPDFDTDELLDACILRDVWARFDELREQNDPKEPEA